MALMNTRTPGAFSAGASVSSRICSASSIRPRPIETRPMSLMRERGPLRNATRPMMNSTGATAAILNDSTCTISVVPTLAPSMMASAGTRLTSPSDVNELVIRAVAVLLWSSAVRPRPAAKAVKRLLRRLCQQQPQVGPERAQDSAVDHMQAPQQQRHAAHQVEKNHGSHARLLSRQFEFEGSGYRQSRADQPFNLLKIARAVAPAMGAICPCSVLRFPVNGVRKHTSYNASFPASSIPRVLLYNRKALSGVSIEQGQGFICLQQQQQPIAARANVVRAGVLPRSSSRRADCRGIA